MSKFSEYSPHFVEGSADVSLEINGVGRQRVRVQLGQSVFITDPVAGEELADALDSMLEWREKMGH